MSSSVRPPKHAKASAPHTPSCVNWVRERPLPHLALQRRLGNGGWQRLLQAKLSVSKPGDEYEQEADRVADHVMRMSGQVSEETQKTLSTPSFTAARGVRRDAQSEDDKTSEMDLGVESAIHALRGRGQPLPERVRAFMEPRFRADFRDVRIHADDSAHELSHALNASAFTIGQDVVFGAGRYAPETESGRRLLAHELTHVLQQRESSTSSVRRWGPSSHEAMTRGGSQLVAATTDGFDLDENALNELASRSTDMDVEFPELVFNLGGWLAEHSAEQHDPERATEADAQRRKLRALNKLRQHYQSNQESALNHGEGGLYGASKPEAAHRNISWQRKFVQEALAEFHSIPKSFSTIAQSHASKQRQRAKSFAAFGNALHIAQDRGAHGDGAVDLDYPNNSPRWGHARTIFDDTFKPDDPSINVTGDKEAKRNTELAFLSAYEMLRVLLDKRYTTVDTATTIAPVTIISRHTNVSRSTLEGADTARAMRKGEGETAGSPSSKGGSGEAYVFATDPYESKERELSFTDEEKSWIREVFALGEVRRMIAGYKALPRISLHRVSALDSGANGEQNGTKIAISSKVYQKKDVAAIFAGKPAGLPNEQCFKETLLHELVHFVEEQTQDLSASKVVPAVLTEVLTYPEATGYGWPKHAFGWFVHPKSAYWLHFDLPCVLSVTDAACTILGGSDLVGIEKRGKYESSPLPQSGNRISPSEDLAASVALYLTNATTRAELKKKYPLRHRLLADYFKLQLPARK